MRSSLTWALLATLILSAIALIDHGDAPDVVPARASTQPADQTRVPLNSAANPPTVVEASQLQNLPLRLEPQRIPPARRDLFALASNPVITTASTAASLESPVQISPTQAPPLTLRYMGTMTDPDGHRLVYVTQGEKAFLVGPKDSLEDGYVVDSINSEAIVIIHPLSGTRTTIPIPTSRDQ